MLLVGYASLGKATKRLQLLTLCQPNTGWFKLNDGDVFPGQSPRRCFRSDREFWYVFYEPLRTPDLAGCFWFVSFCVIVRFLGLFGKFETPWTTYFRQKIIKCKHPQEVKLREGHTDHGCDLSGSISLF